MKVLLVDDEQQVIRGLSRILNVELEDWDIESASTGIEALDYLRDEEFDVVVSDLRMPGMDGVELLETISTDFPQVFRVILSGQASREAVLKSVHPMHQYLSKPCAADRLIQILRRAEIFQQTIKSAEVIEAIGQADCLPTLPENLTQLNDAIEAQASSAAIAEIVSKDPALSAKILQIANSAIFGLSRPVADLAQATSLVGGDMIRSIAIAQALFSQSKSSVVLCAERLFRHSFECAIAARKIADSLKLDKEVKYFVFSSALMHDVGKIVLVNAFPERYRNVIDGLATGTEVWEAEMNEFGATHQGIGAHPLGLVGAAGGDHPGRGVAPQL